ncbi:zinc finger protein 808-like [Belonocnema kinseyi]|uniref:zinc finger protein 808-like n=1 Tax=Belonocnema kinseyi TaxID=2817044 RepID=UPI00143D1A21|nr:zinc finger protein 808-like [Belonocnema kinseyi]
MHQCRVPDDLRDQESSLKATARPKRTSKYGTKACTTEISVHNNSEDKTLIKYDNDETLDIKDEIIQGEESSSNATKRPKCTSKYRKKPYTTEISFHNNSEAKILIEYDNDETVDIKDEITQDQDTEEVTGRSFNTKYDLKVCTGRTREGMLAGIMKQPSQQKQEDQDSEPKNKYKCTKCARSYKAKGQLTKHQKYQCGVMPKFRCQLCYRRFKLKDYLNRHVKVVHCKTSSDTSDKKYNCNNCTRTYTSIRNLNRHKREKHAAVKPQFICDYCGHKTNQMSNLKTHITCLHLK